MLSRIFWIGVAIFIPTVALLYIDVIYGITVRLWLLDNVFHFIGGVYAGLVGAWWGLLLTKEIKLWHVIVGVVLLGGGVEVLQYMTGTGLSPYLSVPVDTTKDMILDLMGGYAAWLWLKRYRQ